MYISEDELRNRLANAKRFLFITGAGLGVASGLQTFRGANGYWNSIAVESLASRGGFEIHPELTWEWYNERFEHYNNAKPNAGHLSLVEFENLPDVVSEIATQNVDGLHLKAGSNKVYELHGNLRKRKCTGCNFTEPANEPFDLDNIKHCELGRIRPNIVWFGENLPDEPYTLSAIAAEDADIIVIAGTSSNVYPAANLYKMNKRNATLIEVNPNPSLYHKVNYILTEGTETGLPKLLELTKKSKGIL